MIFSAIKKAGGEARLVGGVVRDSLLGRETDDVDIAVNLPPRKIIRALKSAKINVIPTGLAHGTITAITDGKKFEITTLRRDVETYGRRAKVEFTDDWQADASRRDFTFNALYADLKGRIYDYFGGINDLKTGQVRFIGNAHDRIKEDSLRILRFFRFHAWYGHGVPDNKAIQACKKLAPLMHNLSSERVWKELKRMLLAPNPAPAIRSIIETKVLRKILPEAKEVTQLERLLRLEKIYKVQTNDIQRLAAIIGGNEKTATKISQRLRLSGQEKKMLTEMCAVKSKLKSKTDPDSLRCLMLEKDKNTIQNGLLLLAAGGEKFNLKKALFAITSCNLPIFPIRGDDVLSLGAKPGPKVGKVLKAVRKWWVVQNFKPSRSDCLKKAEFFLRKI